MLRLPHNPEFPAARAPQPKILSAASKDAVTADVGCRFRQQAVRSDACHGFRAGSARASDTTTQRLVVLLQTRIEAQTPRGTIRVVLE